MIQQRIESDLKEAMRSGDSIRKNTLRMALSALHNKAIELGKKEGGLSDEEVIAVLRTEANHRRDAIAGFTTGGRTELAGKEEAELDFIRAYLPTELSPAELTGIVRTVIREIGAGAESDFPKVMRSVMQLVRGRAGGEAVTVTVRGELAKHARGHE